MAYLEYSGDVEFDPEDYIDEISDETLLTEFKFRELQNSLAIEIEQIEKNFNLTELFTDWPNKAEVAELLLYLKKE